MGPLLLLLGGAITLTAGLITLLSFGESFRVARLLQTTRPVTLERAAELARDSSAAGTYVRVSGRIDSEDAFPDEHRRPLVFRRTRLQVAGRGGWRTIGESRERVPFELHAGLASLRIADAELNGGLVVVPREASGTASEARDRLPADLPATARVRMRIDQISAVDHATVLAQPRLDENGDPVLAAGRGRPLVLTTLEDPEAMRILAADSPRRPAIAATLLVAGTSLLALGTAWALLAWLRVVAA